MKRFLLFNGLIASHLLFSYNYLPGWWYSSLGTASILIFALTIWGDECLKMTGLSLKWNEVLITVLLTMSLLAGAYFLMTSIAEKCDVAIVLTKWKNYYHSFFYTLNEEIILGSILLFSLKKAIGNRPLLISVGVAVVFSVIHFIFYKWIFLDRGILSITTLAVLALIGIVRNNLILTYGHLGYAWALHFSWIAVMFGSHHFYTIDSRRLTEPERFNMYLGSTSMLLISTILAILSVILLKQTGNRSYNFRR
jgi:hypothetical protein